jgi:Holliday junction resolvasome RuvABC endonuclease subunit
MILAIDPGFVTGWALSSGQTGTVSFSRIDHGQMANQYRAWLLDMIDTHRPRQIVLETMFATPNASTRPLAGLAVITHECAWVHDIPRAELAPASIKNTGKAKKPDVMAAVKALGWVFDSEHAADAAAILVAWQRAQAAPPAPAAPKRRSFTNRPRRPSTKALAFAQLAMQVKP